MLIAFRFAVITFVLFGLAYPLLITGLGQLVFPAQANGSLIKNLRGQAIGSGLIGQNFTRPEYFHPRLSANHYDGANSGGFNQGATNKKLIRRIADAASAYQRENGRLSAIPIDAVTTSGSGLDPYISLANAMAQAARIAKARHQDERSVRKVVIDNAEKPPLGEAPYLNVLKANLALDSLKPSQ